MLDSLEPAYTTMAGAEECDLKLDIGTRLWRHAEERVKDLEARSGLSVQQLSAKREAAKAEGRQVAGIGACGSVQLAFQVLDELRKATGQPYHETMSEGLAPTHVRVLMLSGLGLKVLPRF